MTAIEEIAAERKRQVEQEGWAPEHDDEHGGGELAKAAACYALGHHTVSNIGGDRIHIWPWENWAWKPTTPRRNLVKAAALIVAEVERLDRTTP
jgi:hypothetical protein